MDAVKITNKETLHEVIGQVVALHSNPNEIVICKSYIQYDELLYKIKRYKGIKLTYYNEALAKGTIAVY